MSKQVIDNYSYVTVSPNSPLVWSSYDDTASIHINRYMPNVPVIDISLRLTDAPDVKISLFGLPSIMSLVYKLEDDRPFSIDSNSPYEKIEFYGKFVTIHTLIDLETNEINPLDPYTHRRLIASASISMVELKDFIVGLSAIYKEIVSYNSKMTKPTESNKAAV